MTAVAKKAQQQTGNLSHEPQEKAFFRGLWARTEVDENGEDKKVDPPEKVKINDQGELKLNFAGNWIPVPQVDVAEFSTEKGLLEQSFEGRPFIIAGFKKIVNGKEVHCLRCRFERTIDPEGWDAEEDDDGRGDG